MDISKYVDIVMQILLTLVTFMAKLAKIKKHDQ